MTSGQEAAQTLPLPLSQAHTETTVRKLVIFCAAAFRHPSLHCKRLLFGTSVFLENHVHPQMTDQLPEKKNSSASGINAPFLRFG